MALNPDVQRKAQEEIDRVVGSHRFPVFGDRSSMPYLEALYREVMRWRPALPLSLPHASAAEDVYNGYYIPKGAIVLGNIWWVSACLLLLVYLHELGILGPSHTTNQSIQIQIAFTQSVSLILMDN